MSSTISGLHHVTAISGPPQDNVDFYVGVLKQRLVKKTVNFDAPDTYHLYYGDEAGTPGSILTFFPFADAAPGRAGHGMASTVAYAVRPGGLETWMAYLAEAGHDFDGPDGRFGEQFITVHDPDRFAIELIETASADSLRANGPTVAGFHSVTLLLNNTEPTARLMTDLFGYRQGPETVEPAGLRQRFTAHTNGQGTHVDLVHPNGQSIGRQGSGTIHHVAFRAEDEGALSQWRERVREFGLDVTPVIDRQYFKSIYFREPGGVLFEIATDPPGFAVDEPIDELGHALKLPPQHEDKRDQIERVLPPIQTRGR